VGFGKMGYICCAERSCERSSRGGRSMSESENSTVHDPLKSVAEALEAAVHAVKEGAADAQESAANLLPDSEHFLSQLAYRTCYAISYGIVFPSVLVARSIPQNNALVHGLIDGAQAAKDMVEEMKAKNEGGGLLTGTPTGGV
jgi:hypothetical protein